MFVGVDWVIYFSDFEQDGWWGQLLLAILVFLSLVTLQLFFWNLAFMYFVSSKQLKLWVTAGEIENLDAELLCGSFTLKVKRLRQVDSVVKVLLVCSTFVWSVSSQIAELGARSALVSDIFWVLSLILSVLLALFAFAVVVLLAISLYQIRVLSQDCDGQDPKILHLQLVMNVLIFVTYVASAISNLVIWTKYVQSSQGWQAYKRAEIGWTVTEILKTLLITASLWIGLYTFYLFATRPF